MNSELFISYSGYVGEEFREYPFLIHIGTTKSKQNSPGIIFGTVEYLFVDTAEKRYLYLHPTSDQQITLKEYGSKLVSPS